MDLSKIATPSVAVQAMRKNWEMIDALMGGTKAMRAAGRKFLPQFPKEQDEKYQARLAVSTLYPCFSETIAQMTGRVFSREIDTAAVDERLQPFLMDIDNQGSRLSVIANKWFSDALAHGVGYMLVDYPTTSENATLADLKADTHPYFVFIPCKNVLGFRSEIINGVQTLTNFRYIEDMTYLDDDGFTEKNYQQVTIWEKNDLGVFVRRYRNSAENAEFSEISSVRVSVDTIPIVAYQTQSDGFFKGVPPLSELAYLNVKHWQSQSDQDNILHTARVPLLYITTPTGELPEKSEQTVGSVLTILPDGSRMAYTEHSGAAIQAGQQALIELENQMKASGAKMLIKTAVALTDSQARDESAKERSRLSMLAAEFADAIGECLDFMAKWLGFDDGGNVTIIGNIDDISDPANSIDTLIQLYATGIVSRETVFNEAKRRNILSDTVDYDEETEKIALDNGVKIL